MMIQLHSNKGLINPLVSWSSNYTVTKG